MIVGKDRAKRGKGAEVSLLRSEIREVESDIEYLIISHAAKLCGMRSINKDVTLPPSPERESLERHLSRLRDRLTQLTI